MEGRCSQFALITRATDLICIGSDVEETQNKFRKQNGVIHAEAGTLVKVGGLGNYLVENSNSCQVHVIDLTLSDSISKEIYECSQANFIKVSESLWPYVISISDPKRRLQLVQNQEQCRWILCQKQNNFVSVSGDLFKRKDLRYDCIIRYIGPVQELYTVGYFFGLEILHLESGHSPQTEDIPFAFKYINCDPNLSIFTTADWITPLPNETKKKFSTILSDTIDKVCTAFGPSTSSNNALKELSRKTKKINKREGRAQFYDVFDLPSNKEIKPAEQKHPLDMREMSADIENMTTLQNDSKKMISAENEDFKQSIENYERNLEIQHGNASSNTPKSNAPVGILKPKRIQANVVGQEIASPKPLTIMSLEDRDIVVIDKADIRESIKNESNVIVLDKHPQQNIDLLDLLGSNWPNTAGNLASVLNKPQNSIHHLQKELEHQNSSSINNFSQTKPVQKKLLNQFSSEKCSTNSKYSSKTAVIISDNSVIDTTNSPESTSKLEVPLQQNFEGESLAQEISKYQLGIGSMVEVSIPEKCKDVYGVVRWVGVPPGENVIFVGVELEEELNDKDLKTSNGSFNGVSLFQCQNSRAIFVLPDCCSKDRRFVDVENSKNIKSTGRIEHYPTTFGMVDCPTVKGAIAPLKISNLEELEEICGKFKGIQGHHNSCYLDATLFAMFTFTSVFDSLLFRPGEPEDISHYQNVQKVLKEEIVNPLRKNLFVRADRVMNLRQLLDKLSSISGLTSEEKDPEEFLNSLLAQIMRVEPFLKLNSGQDSYFYQLFVEKDDRLSFPTVQQLFEQSFHSSDIKLTEVPSCLIIQMPRFGKNYKMYPRIMPSQVLDITDIIENSPRQCSVCGKLADHECQDCFGSLQGSICTGLESTAFCRKCLETVHMHVKRANHTPKKLSVPNDFRIMAEHLNVPRLYMELFAVVCIETSHYVSLVKCGSGPDAPWCFFDSMADRKGEQNGYNIPEIRPVPDLPQWLLEEGARTLNETSSNDKLLPEHAKRLFCDAYMCMYQSTDVMMYR